MSWELREQAWEAVCECVCVFHFTCITPSPQSSEISTPPQNSQREINNGVLRLEKGSE